VFSSSRYNSRRLSGFLYKDTKLLPLNFMDKKKYMRAMEILKTS
jgi:hypothetical protein